MSMRPHYQLQAWQVSMQLVKLTYSWSKCFPAEEKFGLTSQIRRAAVSIPSNIAEGAARKSSREFVYFLNVARGSLSELDTQYLIAVDLEFAQPDSVLSDCIEHASRLITGLLKRHASKE